MTITIGLPCEVVEVRVQVAPSEHLTPLEEVALKAIGHGVTTFTELEEFLALGTRMTLDLLQDLWRRGYVRVDVRNAAVILASEVARIVDQPEKLRALLPGRVEEEIWSLAVDVISGRVVPIEQTRGARDLLVAPRPSTGWSVSSVPQQDLLSAVISSQRIMLGDGPAARSILGVDLKPHHGRKRTGTQVLHVVVTASRDEQGHVHARVSPDEPLAPKYRDRIDRYLADQLEAPERSRFVEAISGRAIDSYAEPPALSERLQRFRDRVARLDQAPHGTWQDHHATLEHLATAIERDLDAREMASTTATFLASAEEQFHALVTAIGMARHQIVLVGPWIEFDPLNELLDALLTAMRSGVRVVIEWGYNHEDELPDGVANVLLSARERFPGRIVFTDRSARTHAKLAVCDDQWALVTSLNLLGSRRRNVEAGVILTAGADTPWSPVEELLRWARDCYPDYPEARGFLVSSESFQRVSQRPPSRMNAAFGASPPSDDSADEQSVEVRRRLWQREWDTVVDRLEARARQLPVHVDGVVIDGMHRSELNDALQTAKRRLVIASDQMSPAVVTDRFLAKVEDRLRAGVHVRLIHRRWSRGHEVDDERVNEAFARFAGSYGGAFAVREVSNWHAKALVCDDRVVVGSFNFLSFEGHYREGRRSRRSELSVSLAGGDVADRFAEAICSLAGLSAPQIASPFALTPPTTNASGTPRWSVLEVRAARKLVEAVRDERWTILGELPHDVGLDGLLTLLEGMGAPASDIAQMAAAILCSGRTGDGLVRWADRLVAHLWEQRRFVEAMLVREHYGGGGSPNRFITELGAFAGSVAFDEWLETVNLTTLSQTERTAFAIVVAAETLMPESTDLNNAPLVLTQLVNDEPDATLEALVLAHWNRHGALPSDFLTSRMVATKHRQRVRELLAETHARLANWQSSMPPGQDATRVRAYLNRESSPLGRLLEVLEPDDDGLPDRARLQAWWDEYGKDGADSLYSRIELEAGGHVRTRGSRRVAFVRRSVRPVVDSIDLLLAELDVETDLPSALLAWLQTMLADLTLALGAVENVVRELPYDLQLVVEPSLERFRSLVEQDNE